MRARRVCILITALVATVVLDACGGTKEKTVGSANNDGTYIGAGDVTYQLQISRVLNPYATEDSQYLTGLPHGTKPPGADELWYGVFMWAKNQTKHPVTTTDRFDIIDTEGNTYYPVRLNPTANEFAWTPQTLQPSGIEPGPDTTASSGPTQGGLLLFKLNSTVYSNRPLTLRIYAPGESTPSNISLDL